MSQNIMLKLSTYKSELYARNRSVKRKKNDNHLIYDRFVIFFYLFSFVSLNFSLLHDRNELKFVWNSLRTHACSSSLAPCSGYKFYDLTQIQFMQNRLKCVYCMDVLKCILLKETVRQTNLHPRGDTHTPYFFRHPIQLMRLLKSYFSPRQTYMWTYLENKKK